MAQGRSTKIISMIEWIRTSRLSIKNSLWQVCSSGAGGQGGEREAGTNSKTRRAVQAGADLMWEARCALHPAGRAGARGEEGMGGRQSDSLSLAGMQQRSGRARACAATFPLSWYIYRERVRKRERERGRVCVCVRERHTQTHT